MGRKKKTIECPCGGRYLSEILYTLQDEGHPVTETWQERKLAVLKIIDRIWTAAKTEVK